MIMADNILETFLAKAGSIPGIRIDREDYLRNTFGKSNFAREVDGIVLNGMVTHPGFWD